jgi:hypothetical protein
MYCFHQVYLIAYLLQCYLGFYHKYKEGYFMLEKIVQNKMRILIMLTMSMFLVGIISSIFHMSHRVELKEAKEFITISQHIHE